MKYIPLLPTAPARFEKGAVLACGCFDGLHSGHRALIAQGKELAGRMGAFYGVWIPAGAKKERCRLMEEKERNRLFGALGVEFLLEEPFEEIRDLPAEQFLSGYLLGKLGVAGVACGENFTFGKNALGTAEMLVRFCKEQGIVPAVQPSVRSPEGEVISSSVIRDALRAGRPEKAALLLEKNYSFVSQVAHGRAVGRTLGFPTVNLPLPSFCPLRYGVYGVKVRFSEEEKQYPAIANVGLHPTFQSAETPVCEAHLLEMPEEQDLYGKMVQTEFLFFVRDEQQFSSPEALCKQIEQDLKRAKRRFGC